MFHPHGNKTILSMYCISVGLDVSCASESRAPALHNRHIHHFVLALQCAGASQSVFWISWMLGTVSAQLSCRASPRHELCLRYLVSFRDVRHLSLSHSLYDLNSLRDLLDGRHPFLYCWFISMNCTYVVSTAFWIFHSDELLGT